MSRKYKFKNPEGAYFVSFAIVNWIDVFVREEYAAIMCDAITYCRFKKGMDCFAYCIMPSHIHLIFRDQNGYPSQLLKDFKRHTAKTILSSIEQNLQESRKEWMLWMFKRAAKKNGIKSGYQFWQHHNKPIELWTPAVIKQKLDYIHNNPLESGFVTRPVDWKYSSARNYAEMPIQIEIDLIGFIK
jgi:REP element-mobilizing transposase RayT